jgi:hypothetical protein
MSLLNKLGIFIILKSIFTQRSPLLFPVLCHNAVFSLLYGLTHAITHVPVVPVLHHYPGPTIYNYCPPLNKLRYLWAISHRRGKRTFDNSITDTAASSFLTRLRRRRRVSGYSGCQSSSPLSLHIEVPRSDRDSREKYQNV